MEQLFDVDADEGTATPKVTPSGSWKQRNRMRSHETNLPKKKAQVVDRLGLFGIRWYCLRPADIGKWWAGVN